MTTCLKLICLCALCAYGGTELHAKWGRTVADYWVVDISKSPMDDSIEFRAICKEKYKSNVSLEIRYNKKKGDSRLILYTDKYVGNTFTFDKKKKRIKFKIRYGDNLTNIIGGIAEDYKIIINNPSLVIVDLLKHNRVTIEIDYKDFLTVQTEDRLRVYQFDIAGIATVNSLLTKIIEFDKRR